MTETINSLPPFKDKAPVHTYSLFWILFTLILFLDQLSKWIIVSVSGFQLGQYPPFGGLEIIPRFFNIVYAVNFGAAWGMFEGYSWLLIALACLFLALIVVFRGQLLLRLPVYQACFGLISAGIAGNTIDRLLRGHVVDFLDFYLPWYRWPTFNIADSAIVVGTLCYIYLQFRKEPENQS